MEQNPGSPVGWVIFLLIVILAAYCYSSTRVACNSWKLGGIFSERIPAYASHFSKRSGIDRRNRGILLLVVIFS